MSWMSPWLLHDIINFHGSHQQRARSEVCVNSLISIASSPVEPSREFRRSGRVQALPDPLIQDGTDGSLGTVIPANAGLQQVVVTAGKAVILGHPCPFPDSSVRWNDLSWSFVRFVFEDETDGSLGTVIPANAGIQQTVAEAEKSPFEGGFRGMFEFRRRFAQACATFIGFIFQDPRGQERLSRGLRA